MDLLRTDTRAYNRGCMESTKQTRIRVTGWCSSLLFVGFCTISSGQTTTGVATITTYAGPPDAVDGAQATSQFLDLPVAVKPDKAGGFYVVSRDRVYRVTTDG